MVPESGTRFWYQNLVPNSGINVLVPESYLTAFWYRDVGTRLWYQDSCTRIWYSIFVSGTLNMLQLMISDLSTRIWYWHLVSESSARILVPEPGTRIWLRIWYHDSESESVYHGVVCRTFAG